MPLIDWLSVDGWIAAHWHIVALAALFLAYAYRERGQGHDWLGTTGARVIFWAAPVGAVVYALPVQPNPAGVWTAVLAGAMAFIGMACIPHGAGQNLTVPWSGPVVDGLNGINKAERLGYLLAAGMCRLWLISLPLIQSHPLALWLPLAGIFTPLAYWVGLSLPKLPWRLTLATEWGEFLTGASIGTALALVMLV